MAGRITRRDVLKTSAAVAGAAVAAGAIGAPSLAKGGRRPNVLFVAIDDLNDWTGWLGGYPGVKTPNLDRLAKIATGFRSAYTPSPACQSARASILFSVEPSRSGVYTNTTGNWTKSLLRDRPSIVRWFNDAGYETIGTGKIFHDGWRSESDGAAENDAGAWSRFKFMEKFLLGEKEVLEWGSSGTKNSDTEDVTRAKWIVDEVLSKRNDKPFFAALGIRKPHMPWIVPQRWFDEYPIDGIRYPLGALDTDHSGMLQNEDDKDLPEGGQAMVRQHIHDHRKIIAGKGWKSAIQAYLAAASLADHAVGVALDGLLKGPNASDTIICVWSDHGWQLGEKLAWRKFTLWERATHVPLMIGGADLRAGPSNVLISSLDIYPTLAKLGAGDEPKGLDGVSFAKHLRGDEAERRDHVLSTWALEIGEKSSKGGDRDKHFAVRSKTHRLIEYGNGDRELYDERVDPWEWRNLYERPSKENIALADELAAFIPKKLADSAPGGRGEAID